MNYKNYRELTYKVFVKLPNTDTDGIDRWCFDHFGEQGLKWDSYFADDNLDNFDQYFVFAEHNDAVLFSLKWL